MAKETYYFQHDYNARNDDKVLELRSRFGGEGYGIFWMIIETMAENDHGGVKASLMGGLSQGYGVAKAWLLDFFNDCVEIGLFYEESGVYYSKRLLTHKEFRKFLSDQGKAGAVKRWGGDSPPNTPPNAKERKGKEIKGKEINNADGKETDFEEILNPTSFPTWREECSKFLKDEYFKQGFCKDQKIPMGNVEELMKEFVKKLNLENDFKNVAALKIHFTRHYKKHLNGKTYTAFSQSKGFIDVPDNLDYDKMEVW